MGMAEVITAIVYLLSVMTLKNYLDVDFLFSIGFLWRVLVITTVAWIPVHLTKFVVNKIDPADHQKVE